MLGNIGKQASPSHIFHHIRLGEYTTKKFFIDILFFYYLELFSSLNTKLIIPLTRIVLLKFLTYSPYPVITLVNRALYSLPFFTANDITMSNQTIITLSNFSSKPSHKIYSPNKPTLFQQ